MYVTREFLFPPVRARPAPVEGASRDSCEKFYSLFSRGNYILYHLDCFLQYLDCVMADANKAAVCGQCENVCQAKETDQETK